MKALVEMIAENGKKKTFPEDLARQMTGLIANCSGVVQDIDMEIRKLDGNSTVKHARWALSGKVNMATLKTSLEGHKSALSLALELVTMYSNLSRGFLQWALICFLQNFG